MSNLILMLNSVGIRLSLKDLDYNHIVEICFSAIIIVDTGGNTCFASVQCFLHFVCPGWTDVVNYSALLTLPYPTLTHMLFISLSAVHILRTSGAMWASPVDYVLHPLAIEKHKITQFPLCPYDVSTASICHFLAHSNKIPHECDCSEACEW